MLPLKFRATADVRGIEQAQRILSESIRGGLQGLGALIRASVQSRTRFFKGRERKSVKYEVRGRGLNLTLTVYSELVQAIVDELGLPPGTFPPTGPGSRIFRYASEQKKADERAERRPRRPKRPPRSASHLRSRAPRRKLFGARSTAKQTARKGRKTVRRVSSGRGQRRVQRVAFLIARAIYEHGIKPTMPFSKGLAANQNRVMRELQNAVTRAVTRINRGG